MKKLYKVSILVLTSMMLFSLMGCTEKMTGDTENTNETLAVEEEQEVTEKSEDLNQELTEITEGSLDELTRLEDFITAYMDIFDDVFDLHKEYLSYFKDGTENNSKDMFTQDHEELIILAKMDILIDESLERLEDLREETALAETQISLINKTFAMQAARKEFVEISLTFKDPEITKDDILAKSDDYKNSNKTLMKLTDEVMSQLEMNLKEYRNLESAKK